MRKLHKSDFCIGFIFLQALVFEGLMIYLHYRTGSTPDALIAGFYGFWGCECGVLGWIKNNKERKEARRWALYDRREGFPDEDQLEAEADEPEILGGGHRVYHGAADSGRGPGA